MNSILTSSNLNSECFIIQDAHILIWKTHSIILTIFRASIVTFDPFLAHCFANSKPSGGKKSKDRITLMVCSNMSGTDKKKLLVIGKSKQPRCFKNVKSLPVDYEANCNAWMTSEIFENWLRSWDKQLRLQCRKILLLVDNCPAHPNVKALTNIKLEFLPPNTTSIVQPTDQGIIKNRKGFYRKQLCDRLLEELDLDGEDNSNDAQQLNWLWRR